MNKEHYDKFTTTKLKHGGQWTCVLVPVQADGRLDDDRPWYFRARHGSWGLYVGEPGDEDAVFKTLIAEGGDDTDGFMAADDAAGHIHSGIQALLDREKSA